MAGRDDGGVPHLTFDAAKEMRFGDRWIVVGVHVAPGDQDPMVSAALEADHAVGQQTLPLSNEDHVV